MNIADADSNHIHYRRADLFRLISDPMRIAIMDLLSSNETLTVSEIHNLLDSKISQAAISHHIEKLRSSGKVEYSRKGREIHYSLSQDGKRLVKIIEMGV